MLLVNQIKLKPGYTDRDLLKKVSAALKVLPEDIQKIEIFRRSVDARKKGSVFFILNVLVKVKHQDSVLKRISSSDVSVYSPEKYEFKVCGSQHLKNRPVIVGAGPAGLFAAYYLSKAGYKPIVLERGLDVDSRIRSVEDFWKTGVLNPNSNVLFGEGGAGTFSDGKLNTLVKDKSGRNREVLSLFIKFGAPESILYDAKPHVGTDVLMKVVKAMREEIKALGGEFRFNALVTDIVIDKGKVKCVKINRTVSLDCEVLILCIGHSARDTFSMLYEKGLCMEQKDFAVGFRVEHSQDFINKAFYTDDESVLKETGPASYKLTYKHPSGRGVYSFCMCPGGYVVNASSEDKRLCINGMSYSGRSGSHANSAMVVSVNKDDFGSEHPLAGVEFQRKIEEKAFSAANGRIPVEHYGDFKQNVLHTDEYSVDAESFFKDEPCSKGEYAFADVHNILPNELNKAFIDAMEYFDKNIPGFADRKVLVSGVESRTSSPVRIVRNDKFCCDEFPGIYPSGEGAGYAGGIMSAAMDGMKVAEAVAAEYSPFEQ